MQTRRSSPRARGSPRQRRHRSLLIAIGLTLAAAVTGVVLGLRQPGPSIGAVSPATHRAADRTI